MRTVRKDDKDQTQTSAVLQIWISIRIMLLDLEPYYLIRILPRHSLSSKQDDKPTPKNMYIKKLIKALKKAKKWHAHSQHIQSHVRYTDIQIYVQTLQYKWTN